MSKGIHQLNRPASAGLRPRGRGFRARFATGSLFALLLAAVNGCRPQPAPAEGCKSDAECKGDRLCVDGACAEPQPTGVNASASSEPVKTVLVPRDAWFRGGPGYPAPVAAVGPKHEPKLVWELDLGAVVYASPRLGPGPEEGQHAWVGTFSGRFVAVPLTGPRVGQAVVDLELGGRVWSSAAISEGVVYVGTDNDELIAIDTATGTERWRKRLGDCAETRAPGPEGARCDVDGGPTIGPDGDLWVGADGVYRISPDGEIRWHWPEGGGAKHVYSSPVVAADGRAYVGGQDGHITALDGSGAVLWRYKVLADVDGSPGIGRDGAIYVGADDGRVYALRSDGSLRWSFVAQGDIRSAVAMGPAGHVYITSFDGNLYALGEDGSVDWVLPTARKIKSTPVVDAEGWIYFGAQDRRLYGVAPNGTVRWSIDVGDEVDSSVAISESGVLVVGADDGKLRAYQAPSDDSPDDLPDAKSD